MELIEHTYTIQWVGPFSFEEYKEYIHSENTLNPELFNLYYFEAKQDNRYKAWKTYIGIHKQNDGIDKRVNTTHEHLGPFVKSGAKDIKIWIGSFALEKDQQPENIDIVETLFIKAYSDKLTENIKKKKCLPNGSVCIINSYYNKNEVLSKTRKDKPIVFDDVIIYFAESNIFMHGNLSKMKGIIE